MRIRTKLLLAFRKTVCGLLGHKYIEPFAYFAGDLVYIPIYHHEQALLGMSVAEINGLKTVENDVPRSAHMCARCVRIKYREET